MTEESDEQDAIDYRYRSIKEEYPEPLCWLLGSLFEHNKRYWLQGPKYRRRTQGAEMVRKHGLTTTQKTWADELKEILEDQDDNS